MRKINISLVISALAITAALPLLADDLASIKKALTAKYAVTTITADRTDIVTAGSVLVLKKSNLLTMDVTKSAVVGNSYKNGRITQSKIWAMAKAGGKFEGGRTFVSGEKVWLTGIEVKDKEVVFDIYTDAFSDVRYRAKLNFPFEKDETPTLNAVMAAVGEVFDVQQSDSGNGGGQQQQQQATPAPRSAPTPVAAPAPIEAPPPPIAPPPPPPSDPKEIKLGQTPDQVTAAVGQPDKIITLGAKKIYVYKDMKIIFVGGKVSDVQ
jgi:hypothetical protein